MNIAIICFSMTGLETGEKLKKALTEEGAKVVLAKKSRYLPDSVTVSTSRWAGEQFRSGKDGVIFIGACGIAVRSIAPYIVGKKTDPAVLVIDECGNFVISLLSGHLGGANELALRCAGYLGATPVVTTATDLHSRFAVDVFAKKNGCAIFHMKAAKEASAALLAGEKIGFYSEFPWEGELPEGLILCDRDGKPLHREKRNHLAETKVQDKSSARPDNTGVLDIAGISDDAEIQTVSFETGIAVTIHRNCLPFPNTVHVVPPSAVLGMGCRRGKETASVREAAEECLKEADIYKEALGAIASIDLKKEEPGILALSEDWKLPFQTFAEEELKAVKGEFTPSKFVEKITGVDNVCERSAVLASGQGTLIRKKTGRDGVTTALAAGNRRIHFE